MLSLDAAQVKKMLVIVILSLKISLMGIKTLIKMQNITTYSATVSTREAQLNQMLRNYEQTIY